VKKSMTEKETRQTKRIGDYRPPAFLISKVVLHFDLFEKKTTVRSTLQIARNPKAESSGESLVLDGENMVLKSVSLNGSALKPSDYEVSEHTLTLKLVPETFELAIETEIDPENNKALEGLYKSGTVYCTQNEPEGFRRITYFLDRPDVMSQFVTTVAADKSQYPILLSNGNPIKRGDLEGGRHFVTWEDPFKKPCYLFALVAGDLGAVEETFKTKSGRTIQLKIFVDKGNEKRATYAMTCLQKAMKWDEDRFGLECDLDHYMIVAVDAFNQGAMENKGLNIFNSHYVLADELTATDHDFLSILSVIGHEYFHNWTGNRVTVRDWFQLTLKEGLTIFRDQSFSSDMTSPAVRRIEDVRRLKSYQFPEDGGPNAHPIRPASYIEINNFYTPTVYEKGSEVIRMIETLIGRVAFRKGMDLYFKQHDGEAVTADDFVQAMQDASGVDLTQFRRWYHQAGTPVCEIEMTYDEGQQTLTLHAKQSCDSTPDGSEKKPAHFPISVGLIGPDGATIPVTLEGETESADHLVLHMKKAQETFVFKSVPEKPVVSLFRNFSAPVKLKTGQSEGDLRFLMRHDPDGFNRYEASSRLLTDTLLDLTYQLQDGKPLAFENVICDQFGLLFQDNTIDPALAAEMLSPPGLTMLGEEMAICDYESLETVREFVIQSIAKQFEKDILNRYQALSRSSVGGLDGKAIGERTLKQVALRYLISLEKKAHVQMAYEQFSTATNMTDEISALALLRFLETDETNRALEAFYEKWKENALVIDKWFSVHASDRREQVFEKMKTLEQDPVFDAKNPNKIRALYGAFCGNLPRFHHASGRGYELLAKKILEIDKFNPMIAAKLAGAFRKYSRLDEKRKTLLGGVLDRILKREGLSPGVYEIVSKTKNQG